MEQWEDFYSLLQIHPSADADIIQSAYKRLCKRYHPDVNPSPTATDMMRRINLAYETLSSESSRKLYHAQWLRRNRADASGGGAPRVEVRERVVYVSRTPPEASGGTPAAAAAVREYFEHLSARRYREAFELVSAADKSRFSYGEYVEWQESVSALYEVGNPRLRLFKRHDDLKIDENRRTPAEEYSVTVTEKDRATGAVGEYSLSKYAVWEGMRWRVYLGYRDLTPLKMQFKVMASNSSEVQLLGLWERHRELHDVELGLPNAKGFEEAVAREKYRFERYGRPFSIAVFGVSHQTADRLQTAQVLKFVGYVINGAVRVIDSVAYIGDGLFAAVLAETGRETAAPAVRRILRTVRHDVAACFDFDLRVSAGLAEFDGGETGALIEKCMKIMRAAGADFTAGSPAP